MKRTTLVLEDAAMDGVRELARSEGRTMSDVVNALLAEGLVRRRQRQPEPFVLPCFDMGRPVVNLADRDALEAAMER